MQRSKFWTVENLNALITFVVNYPMLYEKKKKLLKIFLKHLIFNQICIKIKCRINYSLISRNFNYIEFLNLSFLLKHAFFPNKYDKIKENIYT